VPSPASLHRRPLALRANVASSIAAIGKLKSHPDLLLLITRRCVPVNGPAVLMLMPIVVAEPPAAICGGLNTQASPAGNPEQLYVTAPLKVPAPTGVKVIEVVAVCPA
jgi:hypothetical protein